MLEVLVVMVVVSITSEKVADMDELTATNVPESEGEVEETVGAVVSVVLSVVVVVLVDSSFSPQEMTLKLIRDMRIMYKTLLIFFLNQ